MKTGILESKKNPLRVLNDFIVSHWEFNNNVLDSVGTNHGSALGTITFPIINGVQMVDFSAGNTAGISVADANSLSFTNGLMDRDFSIDFLVYFDGINTCWILNKRNNTGSRVEYYIEFLNNKMRFILVDLSVGGYRYTEVDFIPALNTIYHFGFTQKSGVLKTYKDGTIIPTTLLSSGGNYVTMENTLSPLYFGRTDTSFNAFNGKMGATTIWKKELDANEMMDVATKKINGISILI